ncbi:hypothetical protein SAMN05443026_2707 [Burkholderia orbicola]|nr:hypothetical protein SAMN05443026_2707 [Burkholderia orbicola]
MNTRMNNSEPNVEWERALLDSRNDCFLHPGPTKAHEVGSNE